MPGVRAQPNDAIILFLLSWTEAAAGNVGRAKELADQALRISPKDRCIGTAHLAHAMSAFIEQDFTGRRHRGELAVQSHPTAPIRRVPMIVYAAEVGDTELLHTHREALQRVAPDFYRVCSEASFVPFASPSI